MIDPIMKVQDEEALKDLLEREKDSEEYQRLIKSPYQISKIKLFHRFGVGDCPCSNCNRD